MNYLGSTGHLVTITSAAEEAFVAANVLNLQPAHSRVYIGLTDREDEGAFLWITGEPVTYVNWQPGEPNNAGEEDFGEMIFFDGVQWLWNDLPGLGHFGSYIVEFDGPFAGGVLTNDSDPDHDTLAAVLVAPPQHGTVTLNLNGTFVYTPNPNFAGTDSFTYKANDGELDSNVSTVVLTIEPVDDSPAAVPDNYAVDEDQDLTVATADGVLANDSDPEEDEFTAELVDQPDSGELILNPDGSFTYLPLPHFFGQVSFTYRAANSLESEPTLVTIDVTPVNDAPRAGDDAYAIDEDGTLVISDPPNSGRNVLSNDADIDSETLTAELVDDVSNGKLTLVPDGTFEYLPEPNFNGVDSFTYRASDGKLRSELAKVTITVNPINDPPTTEADQYSIAEDGNLTVAAEEGVLANDLDLEGDAFKALVETGPANGILLLSADGSFTYTPNVDYFGVDKFTYRAHDPDASEPTTVSIEVTPMNDAPVATNDTVTVTEDIAIVVNVLANDQDVDGDELVAKLVDAPSNGTVTINGDGTFTYLPSLNFTGVDAFTYQVSDGELESGMATVTLDVTPVNDAPLAAADIYFLAGTLTVGGATGLLANDTDVDSVASSLTVQLVSPPAHGVLTLNPDGSFTYTQGISFTDSDTFSYRTSDGSAVSELATVSIVAALRLRTENVTVVANPEGQVEGQFDVFVDVAPGVDLATGAYNVSLRTPAASGVTLVSASPPSPAHPGIFASEPVFFTAQGRLTVTDGLGSGAARLEDGDGLFRIRFIVAPGTMGEVPILFTTAFTSLADEDGQPLPLVLAPGKLTLVLLPGAVTDVTASATAANTVRLTWTDSFANESGFKIERLQAGVFAQVATVGSNVTSFDDVNLQSSVEHIYRVRAYNAAGDGPASGLVSATTPQLVTINGTPGHDTFHAIRVGSLLNVYDTIPAMGPPIYVSEVAALAETLTINGLGGDDLLIVLSIGETPIGVDQIIYNAGTGANQLLLASGPARIDSSAAAGGTLHTTVQSAGRLTTSRFVQDGLVMENSSRVKLLPDGETSVLTGLTIGTGAIFDIANNALVVDYAGASPLAAIRQRIISGRGGSGLGGSWNGTGITSVAVRQTNLADPESRSIGYAENASLPLGAYTTFRGVAVDDTSVLIAYTFTADANLDGVVNDADATVLGASYDPTRANAVWALGDFDYNGIVDDSDATLLGVLYQPEGDSPTEQSGENGLFDLLAQAVLSDQRAASDGLIGSRLADGRQARRADALWKEALWL
jgi:VCBS repeat-containing protein